MIWRTQLRNALAAGLMSLLSMFSVAVEIKVVANPSVRADSISATELRSIFLSETRALQDGSQVEPVFERSGPVHDEFLRDYLKQSSATLQSHYGALVFTGKASMPKTFNSDADVLAYVARTKGAIGYVSAGAEGQGIKILAVKGEGGKPQRTLVTRVEPQYPETLRQLGIGGTVRLQVVITPQGRVESATLLGGNPILGEAAIKAVSQWVYAPAATSQTIEVSIPFEALH
ncbi:MAG TPA: TonB family protein [Candidatus Solibacter sp.]|nr:TonB family protein [Candidatus Solibacter sp.]